MYAACLNDPCPCCLGKDDSEGMKRGLLGLYGATPFIGIIPPVHIWLC